MNNNQLKTNALKCNIVENALFVGKYDFPKLKRTDSIPENIIPFNCKCNSAKEKHWVHFYIDDYKFEKIWNNPKRYLDVLKKYAGVIGSDFSTYLDMPLAQQIWNLYRNRAISHFWQDNDIDVIPNVQWGDENSYEYCFDGIPSGGTVAISTNGAINGNLERYYFKKGLSKMIEVIKPKTVINYGSMPDDIFAEYKTGKINFIHFNNYNDIVRGRCCCNG